jgi:hypothetical protein
LSITFYENSNARQERAARAQITGKAQAVRNAREWNSRADVARENGELALSQELHTQALLELQPYCPQYV